MEDYIGKNCPYCKTEIKEGEAVKVCSSCGTPHHEDCWEKNKGCTTPGCSEQTSIETQHTNTSYTCLNCGTLFGDGEELCPKCGTPKDAPKANLCVKCGAELQEDQEYCSKCGHKVGADVDPVTAAQNGKSNSDFTAKKKKVLIAIIAGVIVVAAVVIVLILSGAS